MKTNLKIHLVSFFILFAICSSLLVRDSQAQWTSVNYNFWGKGVSSFAVSGDTIFSGAAGAFYYSTNYGVNWNQFVGFSGDAKNILFIENKIYLGSTNGIWVSTNRGLNWTNMGLGSNFAPVAVSGNTIYTGTWGGGVYFTTNNGTNWIQTTLNNKSVISVLTKDNAIIAGVSGGIFVSTDNGITWTNPLSGPAVYTLKVSGNKIYSGTSSGVYLSTNNGLNWTQINTYQSNGWGSSMMISGTELYYACYSSPNYMLLKTTNDGLNWSQIISSTKIVANIMILNGNYLCSTSPSGYISSTDNGLTWLWPQPNTISAITQSGSNLYAGTSDGVYSSTDGGNKWYFRNHAPNTYSILTKDTYVFAGTAGSGVYYTTNNGLNWIQTTLNNKIVWALARKDPNILAATATSGIYYSSDNGTNWIQSSINSLTVKSLYVKDSIIYAGTIVGGVYKSADNGVNWTPTSLIYIDVNALIAVGGNVYAGTAGQGVYLSSNNGANWSQTSFNNNTIISFSNYGSTIFAGTSGSGVYMTKNAGVNWTQVNDGMGNQQVGALSTYGNYVIAGTGGNGFWRRYILEFAPIRGDANLDSAVNVLDVTADVNYILGNPPVPFSTLAADVNTDLVINVLDVVGTVNIILHPTFKQFANKENNDISGSANLYIQNNNLKMFSTMPVKGIQFNLTGAGAQNVTFTPSSVLTNYQVVSGSKSDTAKTFIIFTMSDTALSAGNHTLGTFTGLTGGIAMNQVFISDENGNGILTSGGENENTEIPKEYSLQQNYPNPFNPVTTIGFQIPKSGITSLKIYDVTGRLIKTLVNEFKQTGNYKVEFDAGSVASGVYFYKLTSGDFVSTRKMVVLK